MKIEDWIAKQHAFVMVYRLPHKLTDGFSEKPIVFTNVDWFECAADVPRGELIGFLRQKAYFSFNERLLVIGDVHEGGLCPGPVKNAFTFIIENGRAT